MRNNKNMSPIEYLIVRDGDLALDCFKYLFEHTKAGVDRKHKEGLTLLHQAAIFSHVGICRYLIGKGENVNEGDKSGRYCFLSISFFSQKSVVLI